MTGLHVAYALNIVILVPVALSTLITPQSILRVFEGKFPASDGLRVLVGSFWTAILICSITGLAYPKTMMPLLGFQVIYKASFLLLFAAPALARGDGHVIPVGMSLTFVAIILIWPVILWTNWNM